ncbi:MAG: hypothetical protein HY699_11625 [Deltaproteobacteria bacterium]|nr:hypothetical protein [Deltaproteobacteria bacterium]
MGVVALSRVDEERVERLRKSFKKRSKAELVRLALDELERRVERRALRVAVRQYVKQHGALDRAENAALSPAGTARRVS